MRKNKLQIGKYYHIYNRGAGKQEIFFCASDYFRFIESIFEFNSLEPSTSLQLKRKLRKSTTTNRSILVRNRVPNQELCEVICYNILPNHYHFILKETTENGISSFVKRVAGGYSNYTKHRHGFSGAMFQGRFKAIEVGSDNYLHYLIAYILKNAEIHKIKYIKSGIKNYKKNFWPWSNLLDLENEHCSLHKLILDEFSNINSFKSYMYTVLKNSSKIKEEKKLYLFE